MVIQNRPADKISKIKAKTTIIESIDVYDINNKLYK